MIPHPSEIAKDLKGYYFFKTFSEDLLLQIAAVADFKTYKSGESILQQGEANSYLYFLRKGHVEVLLNSEVVAILQNPGEVMGEISVLNETPVGNTLKAVTEVECYVLDSKKFTTVSPGQQDHFSALLYRIYSIILSERLKKTNEKARLFEISNRELRQIHDVKKSAISGRVMVLESEKRLQVLAKLVLGGSGLDLTIAQDVEAARASLADKPVDLLISEDKCLNFIKEAHEKKWSKNFLLMTTENMRQNLDTLKQLGFVDYVVSRDTEDRTAASKALLTAINKVITKDLFGPEKYLSWGAEVIQKSIVHSGQRDELKEEMAAYFKKFGIRSSVLDRVNTVCEELLMNAIYDAPVDAYGKSLFNHKSRKEGIMLDTHQQSRLSYACDGVNLIISVDDPFGALSKDIIINYLVSCYDGQAGSLNTEKGGAGRGLHQIIENTDLTVFNVKKGIRTEVICSFNLDSAKKEAQPSLHYFFI